MFKRSNCEAREFDSSVKIVRYLLAGISSARVSVDELLLGNDSLSSGSPLTGVTRLVDDDTRRLGVVIYRRCCVNVHFYVLPRS